MADVESEGVQHVGQLFGIGEVVLLTLEGADQLGDFVGDEGLDLIWAGLTLSVAKSVVFKGGVLDELRS